MPGRVGSRFALEAGFLILLAVLTAVADLRWQAIVVVMAIAWLLIALLEWAFWREGPQLPHLPYGPDSWAPPPPQPSAHREEATRVIRPAVPQAPAQALEAAPAEARRGWFGRARGAAAAPPDSELPPESEPGPAGDEVGVEPEPAAEEPQAQPEPQPEAEEPKPEPEREPGPDEPALPRPWWWRRREPDAEPESQPRHVRVLPPKRDEEEK
jgi:hypothetical protein